MKSKTKKEQNLKALEALENGATNVEEVVEKPNRMDGYIQIDKNMMPHQGRLYPDSWEFAYRCPTAREVAAFSTVVETDQPAVISVTEDLIRKCVIVYDSKQKKQLSSGNINDGDRTFFLLLLRDYYLPNQPVSLNSVCQNCKEAFNAKMTAYNIEYSELRDKLIDSFDGRKFTLETENGNTIKFHVPTLDTSSRVFKHLVKSYRTQQNQNKNKNVDETVYDKTFLFFAPYLFETGNETIREITLKYKQIKKDDSLFKDYLTIASKLKLDNLETFESECSHCGSLEETQITFPGGIKNLFIGGTTIDSYF